MISTFIFLSTYPTAPIFIPFLPHFADITTSQSCPFFFHFSVDPLLVPVLLSVYDFLYLPIKFAEWWLIHFHQIAMIYYSNKMTNKSKKCYQYKLKRLGLLTFVKKGSMRIRIRTLLPHQIYSCKVQSYIFCQAFLNFINSPWGKYFNQFWLPHKRKTFDMWFQFKT